MVVLDEQPLGYGLAALIGRWYKGAVRSINDLRPGTVIPDDAIPELLRRLRQPTFVTINVMDFWRQVSPDPRFAIGCFALKHAEAQEISPLLRRPFSIDLFRARRLRVGKVIRISRQQVQYYTTESWAVRSLRWPGP